VDPQRHADLLAAMLATAPREGSHVWSQLESPDPRGRALGALAWLDLAEQVMGATE